MIRTAAGATHRMTERKNSIFPFLLLCLIGFIAMFGSYLRTPVMPLYAASLGADSVQVGIINGAFMLTAGILSIPAGLLADRIGRKIPVVAGCFAISISSLLIPLCHLPVQMAAVYILFGAGLAAFAPGMLSLVADVTPAEKFGQAYSWYTTAGYCAMTVGPATGGFLAGSFGLQEVFFISGGVAVAATLLAVVALPDGIPRHKSDVRSIWGSSLELLRNRFLQACLVATVGSCMGIGVFLTFLPLFAVAQGLDSSQVGIVFAAQAFANVVCRIPIGVVADKIDRRWIVATGLLLLALSLGILGRTGHLHDMVLCAIVLGVGMALIYTAVGALIAEQVPPLQRGLAMGMYHSSVFLGMMAGSTAMGIALKKISYASCYLLSGGVALLALVWFLALLRNSSKRIILKTAC